MERELVFDVDLTDYDDVRTCGKGGHICNKCWPLMAVAIKVRSAPVSANQHIHHQGDNGPRTISCFDHCSIAVYPTTDTLLGDNQATLILTDSGFGLEAGLWFQAYPVGLLWKAWCPCLGLRRQVCQCGLIAWACL